MAVTWKSNNIAYDEWLLARNKGIGASETGAICFGTSYSSNLELYYSKIGLGRPTIQNIRMDIGTMTEPLSVEYWKYYEGSEQSILANKKNNRIVKDCFYENKTAFNDKFPWLSATPDAIIKPFGIYEGKSNGVLEIKNTMGFVLKSYDGGLPISNLCQVVTQMLCTEMQYGEIFYFIDNSRFECHYVPRKATKNLEELIITKTEDFWNRVISARPLANELYEAKRNYNMRRAAELETAIAQLEPEVQSSQGYLNFINERFKERSSGAGLIVGTEEQLKVALKYNEIAKKIDKLEKQQLQLEIELKKAMKENTCLDFGKAGKITWYPNKNNNRIFNTKHIN